MGDVFEYFLETEGIEHYEAKTRKDQYENCWISPEGKWYSVGVCNHQVFAYHIFKKANPRDKDQLLHFITKDFENAGDWLRNQGWIMIESNFCTGTLVRGYENMTEKQYRVLLAHFNDQRLFRGWTIRAMWLAKADMKQEAKTD